MSAYQKGKLTSWNDDRGFGFIDPENGTKKVFIHISAFKKRGRRPQTGDIIYYQLDMDKEDRIHASQAYIEGTNATTSRRHRASGTQKNSVGYIRSSAGKINQAQEQRRAKRSKRKNFILALLLLFIIIAGIKGLFPNPFQGVNTTSSAKKPASSLPSSSSQNYTCEGKTRCSEMKSCEEAKFYLNNCPNVQIDGDGDGIPCESQWCGN